MLDSLKSLPQDSLHNQNHRNQSETPAIPSLLDLISIQQPKFNGKLSGKSITPSLIHELAQIVEQNPLVRTTLLELKREQIKMEQELLEMRRNLCEKHEKMNEQHFAREIVGSAKPGENFKLEVQAQKELEEFDKTAILKMENLVNSQQIVLQAHKIPYLYPTQDPKERSLQQKIVAVLYDMANSFQ